VVENMVARDGVEPPTPAVFRAVAAQSYLFDSALLSQEHLPDFAHLIGAKMEPSGKNLPAEICLNEFRISAASNRT